MRAKVLLACLLLALLPASGRAADPVRTARLALEAGLLEEAKRAQGLYVDELVRLGLPDDGDAPLVQVVRSAFPASRIRERWLGHLASQLTEEELAAAEAFHASVPGRGLIEALARQRGDEAPGVDAPPELRAAAADLEASAREAVLRVRTSGAARWLVRREAGEERVALAEVWRAALAEQGEATRSAELRALLELPRVHALAVAEYAASSLGRRFYGKLTATLDLTLEELVREHRGLVRRALAARAQSPG